MLKLAVSERLQRLEAIQDRWDRVRAAIDARAREDYEAMMKTGIVIRGLRNVGHRKDAQVVEEYEIDTAAIEALNSIEKRAAIETGQEVDRADINLRGNVQAQAEMLRKAFTLEELEVMDAKIEAAKAGTPKLIDAPAAKPVEKTEVVVLERDNRAPKVPGNVKPNGTVNGHVNGKESWR